MVEVIVTRGGQITLTRDVREKLQIREGDTVIVNREGESVRVSKKDPKAFEIHNFLPESFSKTLHQLRDFSYEKRLKRLRII